MRGQHPGSLHILQAVLSTLHLCSLPHSDYGACRQKYVTNMTSCICRNSGHVEVSTLSRGHWCAACLSARMGENIHEVINNRCAPLTKQEIHQNEEPKASCTSAWHCIVSPGTKAAASQKLSRNPPAWARSMCRRCFVCISILRVLRSAQIQADRWTGAALT